MNTLPVGTYKPSQKLHPLSLIAQLNSRQTNGCLQVMSNTTTWAIYLEHGKILYTSNTVDPFGRLDRQLRRLSSQVPSLVSAVRVQVRLLFENNSDNHLPHGRDYEAICWLVEQQHLTPEQAVGLIEELAKEVLESFLVVQTGSYELIEQDLLSGFPKFCQLDPRPLVEHCQTNLRRRSTGQSSIAARTLSSNLQSRIQNPAANPSQDVAQGSQPQGQSAYRPPAPRPADGSGKTTFTIACIDDSPTVLQAINSFLDDKSFSVVLINDPIKALMQVIRTKPDLILLDVTMPNLDGYELCSLLRKHPSFRQTPIIMVTGNTGFIDRAKAKLVGASGYLTKPFTQPDLIKMVFKHLN
ncbi:response regulator [Phormidium tenue FACHB-886]|nr:response regulator [Phormidium tenue FACHB-886]